MAAPIIGRRQELHALEQACRRTAPLIAVTGPAGVGKSRLLAEVGRRLDDDGWRVVTIVGSHAVRHIPMGPLISMLPDDPPASEALLLAHVLNTMVGDGDDQVVVSADDAHLLDDLTLALLVELVHRGDAVVALGIRTPEEMPLTLARMLGTDGTVRVEVGPLPADDLAALAEAQLGGPLDEAAAAEITDAARGNPLMLREVVDDAVRSGALGRRDGRWHLEGELRAGARLAELIQLRTRTLSRELVDVLERVAIAEPVEVALADPDGTALGELERRRLARLEERDGSWVARTDHPIVGEAIRNSMSTGHRLAALRDLCRLIGERGSTTPAAASKAAGWFRELGDELPAAVATEAAWAALVSHDLDTAIELATPAAGEHWRAAFVLAEVVRSRGDGLGAVGWYARAVELADDDAAIRRIAMSHSAVLAFQLNDPKAAVATLRDAAGRIGDPAHALELLCEAALAAALLGEFDEAVDTCRHVLGRPGLDSLTTWTASINLAYAQVMLGDVTELRDSLGRAESVLPSIRREHPEGTDLFTALRIGEEILGGDLAEAAALALRRLDRLRRAGSHRGVAAAISTDALLFAGDPRALDVAFESVQQLRLYDPFNSFAYGVGYAALISCLRGDVGRARELLAEIDHDALDVRGRAVVGRAEAALAAGDDPDRAASVALDAGMFAIEASHVSLGIFGVFDAFAYGDAAAVAPVLADACAGSTSPLIRTIGEHAAGVAAGDVGRAGAAALTLDTGGAAFLAAFAFAATAELYDDQLLARRAAARAMATLLRAGPLDAPWAEPDVEGRLSLREVEVAVAAAEGRSNKEIADDLYVSARTVGNHLHRAYAKLGVEGRTQLAAALELPLQ